MRGRATPSPTPTTQAAPKRAKQGHTSSVQAVAFFKDGRRIITASSDDTLRICDVQKQDLVGGPFEGHKRGVNSVAVSHDDRRIASGGGDGAIIIWDVESRQKVFDPLVKHSRWVNSVCFSPDDKRLASGSCDRTIILWDVETGAALATLEGHHYGVLSVAFSPDGLKLASGSLDCTIRVWRTVDAELLLNINAHQDSVRNVVWSPDGQLVTASWDKTVQFWNSSGDQIGQPCTGHTQWIVSLAISSDGSFIATASFDKTVRLWSTKTHQQIARAPDYASSVRCIAISPNGELLVSGHDDRKVRLWSIKNILEQYNFVAERIEGREAQRQEHFFRSDTQLERIGHHYSPRNLYHPSETDDASDGDEHSLFDDNCLPSMRSLIANQRRFMRMIDEDTKDNHLEWSTTFKKNFTTRCVPKGDESVAASDYETAIDLYSPVIGPDSSNESLFAHHTLERNSYVEALYDADKVIELDPSSYLGYDLRHAALHGAQRYDEAIEAFKTILLKLDNAPDAQTQKLRQQYVNPSEVEDTIRRTIHAQLENAPLRLLNTFTGRLCDQDAQTSAFMESTEYKEILSSSMTLVPLQMEPITEVVAKYFRWVMLSHRWERKELLLHDIRDEVVYELGSVGPMVKLQTFCKVARDAGHRWAWSDTCCIDQTNNVELQRSVNSMFLWYRQSALTIVYLSDVPPSAKSGALANSAWNTRGWTVQEFLAPKVVLFYKRDWTLYLSDRSPNHKESIPIMQELEDSTRIDSRTLVTFRPGMRDAREKLQWASSRFTTLQEDIAYSLFGIFGVHLPVIYGEGKQNALGRLLQEIVARSGDITALDWVGKSSTFNSCLPAEITSYKAPPCTLLSIPEDEMQISVFKLRNTVAGGSALKLYSLLDNLSAPRFTNSRLHLPCIAFVIIEVRRRRVRAQETCFTYHVKADGLQDLSITTEDRLVQFSRARPIQQTFLLVRPWNRYELGLPDFAEDSKTTKDWSASTPWSLSDHSLSGFPGVCEPVDSDSHSRALRLIARLGQPFGALLLAQQRGGEYKRITSDNNISAQVKDMASVHNMMDVRALEIL